MTEPNADRMEWVRRMVAPVADTAADLIGLALYGSRARGDAGDASGYDFVAVCGADPDLAALEERLTEALGRPAEVTDQEWMGDRMRSRIKADLRQVWGEPVDWPDVEAMSSEDASRDFVAESLEVICDSAGDAEEAASLLDPGSGLADMFAAEVVSSVTEVCRSVQDLRRCDPGLFDSRFSRFAPDVLSVLSDTERPCDSCGGPDLARCMDFVAGPLRGVAEQARIALDEMDADRGPGKNRDPERTSTKTLRCV